MADPRPTADDPLIIFGSVSLPARQGPSTVNPPLYGGSSGGIPNFGDPQLGCKCLCCPPMPPGCMIAPLPCEYPPCGNAPSCDFLPFPPQFPSCCCVSDKPILVLGSATSQCVCSGSITAVSFDTVDFNRGFEIGTPVTSVTIPKSGLYHLLGSIHTASCVLSPRYLNLVLYQCCSCSTIQGAKVLGCNCASCFTMDVSAYKNLDGGNLISLKVLVTGAAGAPIALCDNCSDGRNTYALQFVRGC